MEMPTAHGAFVCTVWSGERGRELVALSTRTLDSGKEVMVRIHSECLTGDVFASQTCDCGVQKNRALEMIQKHGNGIFIYHRQEGRNMGLYKKVQAYNLMQGGMDTHEANLTLVGHPDGRDYNDVLSVLHELLRGRKSRICLLTNNPHKKLFLARSGYSVTVEPHVVAPTEYNAMYTETKEVKFLHNAHGSEPYVGITLYQSDLKSSVQLKKMLLALNLKDCGRQVYLGVAIFPDKGDTKNSVLVGELNEFAAVLADVGEVRVVLHVNYPDSRSIYRDLKKFLTHLTFRYSLQFRLPTGSEAKVDTELIASLHADRMIFQLKSEQFPLLEQKDFREYFSRPYRAILLDESFGTGMPASFEATKQNVLTLVSRGMSRIAVAGGYSAENADRLFELEDFFKIPISIDAESRLREGEQLSIAEAERYLWKILRPTTSFPGLTSDQAIQVQKKLHQHTGSRAIDFEVDENLVLNNFQVHEYVLNPQIVSDAKLFAQFLYKRRAEYAGKSVIDMGTGSGVLGITMALGGAKEVIGADVSSESVANARANVRIYSLEDKVRIVQSDLFSALEGVKADLIVFNHPYFPTESIPGEKISIAMFDPGELLQRFLKEAKDHLLPGGSIIMPYHEFAGDINDPERHAAKYGYKVSVKRQEVDLAFRKGVFKVCTLCAK